MPAIPPTALNMIDDIENIPAPQRDGITLPKNEPIIMPPQIRVFELTEIL